MLTDQVQELLKEKKHLEDTISKFAAEKLIFLQKREESKLKIASLQQHIKDLQQQVTIADCELDITRGSNSQLQDQLEDYIVQASFTSHHLNNSLLDELESCLSESDARVLPGEQFYKQPENEPEKISELNKKLNDSLKEVEKLSKQNAISLNLRKDAEVTLDALQQQVNHQERELITLRREREIMLNDTIEDALRHAMEDRAKACKGENVAMLLLEQAKSDMAKLNNQLLEAVQQKLQLSEQLEMWQVDMATLLERQLRNQQWEQKRKASKLFPVRWSWSSPVASGHQQERDAR